ncbi:MAG: hypothetical protein AB1758_11335 [Candidatus Eremiobacterota bacterium]
MRPGLQLGQEPQEQPFCTESLGAGLQLAQVPQAQAAREAGLCELMLELARGRIIGSS